MFTIAKKCLAGLAVAGSMLFAAALCQGQTDAFTGDFEEGNLRGWEAAGTAFRYQPTRGDNPTARNRGQPSNHQGRYWIGTYEKFQGQRRQKPGDIQGDEPVGALTSMPFTIPRGTLEFLVGGGREYDTRVELFIQDPIEGSIRGPFASGENSETMRRVSWDLTPYAGKTGRIRIVDNASGPWGHINADDFRIIPADTPATITVPDLGGLTAGQSAELLERSGLRAGQVTRRASARQSDTVIEQDPPQGTEVRPGTAVALILAEEERTPGNGGESPDRTPPATGNHSDNGLPPPPGIPKWVWSIPGLLAAWGAFRVISRPKKGKTSPATATIRYKIARDSGSQTVEPLKPRRPGPEIRLRAVSDRGRQEITGDWSGSG